MHSRIENMNVFVTVKQMREMEEAAVKRGTALSTLMENAGKAVADEAMALIRHNASVVTFAGYGNNGGDGLVAARYLLKSNYQVKTFLVGSSKSFSPQTQENYDALIKLNHKPEGISTIEEIEKAFASPFKPTLVIDAIFGIGIRGGLDDFYVKLIDKINALAAPTLAVDIPSGLDADSGEPLGAVVRATETVTFGCAKAGFKNPEAKQYIGEVVVADIGL